jgi:hypothetical protein
VAEAANRLGGPAEAALEAYREFAVHRTAPAPESVSALQRQVQGLAAYRD